LIRSGLRQGCDNLDKIAGQRLSFQQQCIDIAEGGVGAFIDLSDQRMLCTKFQRQPQHRAQREPKPLQIESRVG